MSQVATALPQASGSQPPRSALVLSGGGITGFLYEIGALAAIEETLPKRSLHAYFDLFVGTSAGAVAAALIANGAKPSELFRILGENEDSPFNFRPRDVFGVAGAGFVRLLGRFAAAFGAALGRAMKRGNRPSLAAILADFQEHHPPGFYSTEPLEQTLCSRFTRLDYAHHFSELPKPLFITGTDIDTGERLVFGAGEFRTMHVCRAVAASCTIPIFFQPIRIGERDVVDGAIAEATPIDIAVEQGARRVLYLNPLVPIENDRSRLCLPHGDGYCARLADKGVGWIGEQSLRLLLAAKLDHAVAALSTRHPDLSLFAIQPARHEIPMFMHNVMSFAARAELLAYGYECGRRALRSGLGDFLGTSPAEAGTNHPQGESPAVSVKAVGSASCRSGDDDSPARENGTGSSGSMGAC